MFISEMAAFFFDLWGATRWKQCVGRAQYGKNASVIFLTCQTLNEGEWLVKGGCAIKKKNRNKKTNKQKQQN